MLLIANSTAQYTDSISNYIHQRHNEVDTSDNILTEKIIEVNRQKLSIENSKTSSFKTQLITNNEINILLDSVLYFVYDKLYEKYPTAYGIITFSRPPFTIEHKHLN